MQWYRGTYIVSHTYLYASVCVFFSEWKELAFCLPTIWSPPYPGAIREKNEEENLYVFYVCVLYMYLYCVHITLPSFSVCLKRFLFQKLRDYNLSTHTVFFSLELVEVCTSIVEHSTNKFISTLRININLKRRKDFLPLERRKTVERRKNTSDGWGVGEGKVNKVI